MSLYQSYRIDGIEMYCRVQIYNHLSSKCHIISIRLPSDYMAISDIEKYVKEQVETTHISFLKIIGIGASLLGHRDYTA